MSLGYWSETQARSARPGDQSSSWVLPPCSRPATGRTHHRGASCGWICCPGRWWAYQLFGVGVPSY